MKRRQANHLSLGYSLTEVLSAGAVMVLVAMSSMTVLTNLAGMNKTSLAQASNASENKNFADQLLIDVHRASGVLTSTSALGAPVSSGAGTLALVLPVTDQNGVVQPSESEVVTYSAPPSGGSGIQRTSGVLLSGTLINSSLSTRVWASAGTLSLEYFRKSTGSSTGPASSSTSLKSVGGTQTESGSTFDGKAPVDPSAIVSGSNVNGAQFVEFTVTSNSTYSPTPVFGGAQIGVSM